MPKDKTANHIRLMAAARQEFLELGYEKASMRSIGARCGLTAAAIYRHCRDKEDLFDRLVRPCVERMEAWMEAHVARYMDDIQVGHRLVWRDSEVDMMREIVYPDMEDYYLLLARSAGTKYENFLHDLTEKHQEGLMKCLPLLREQGFKVWDITPDELHLLITAYTTALFEPVMHNYSQEEAMRCLKTVEVFFLPGWKKLLGL